MHLFRAKEERGEREELKWCQRRTPIIFTAYVTSCTPPRCQLLSKVRRRSIMERNRRTNQPRFFIFENREMYIKKYKKTVRGEEKISRDGANEGKRDREGVYIYTYIYM